MPIQRQIQFVCDITGQRTKDVVAIASEDGTIEAPPEGWGILALTRTIKNPEFETAKAEFDAATQARESLIQSSLAAAVEQAREQQKRDLTAEEIQAVRNAIAGSVPAIEAPSAEEYQVEEREFVLCPREVEKLVKAWES